LLYSEQLGIFSSSTSDPDGDDIRYRFDWDAAGVHDYSEWTSLVHSEDLVNMSHFWDSPGIYAVKTQACDEHGLMSNWSDSFLVTISQHEPPSPPVIDGPTQGKAGIAYLYTFVSTNPDENNVFYWIEWGDGSQIEWAGPYTAGQLMTNNHTFIQKGAYTIKAKAKDIDGVESDWTTLQVTMPKTGSLLFNSFLQQLFRQLPNVFPLFQYLLGY
jgi:hypothetical protein